VRGRSKFQLCDKNLKSLSNEQGVRTGIVYPQSGLTR